MTSCYYAPFIPTVAEGNLGYRYGKYPGRETLRGLSVDVGQAIPGLAHECHKVFYESNVS